MPLLIRILLPMGKLARPEAYPEMNDKNPEVKGRNS
jgi:hypothetical protein